MDILLKIYPMGRWGRKGITHSTELGQRELGKENELNGTETTVTSAGVERSMRYY